MTEDRGKQQSAKADSIAGSAYDDKILLADVEQPKHLLVYDLGLGDSDQAFHSLSTHDHIPRPIKNFRIRSQAAETGGEANGRRKIKSLCKFIQAGQERHN